MTAEETLAFTLRPRPGAPTGVRRLLAGGRRVLTSTGSWRDLEPPRDAVVVRRSSGHPVLTGPVEPALTRFLRRAVESDLAAMSEADFLRAWGPPGGWKQRYERWRLRGTGPAMR